MKIIKTDTYNEIDINKLIEKMMSEITLPDNVHINIKLDNNIPTIIINESLIYFVIEELIDNAVNAIGEENTGQIKIEVKTEQSDIICTISDNGCGISEEDLEKIFEENFTTAIVEGHGKGLYLCNRIISTYKGKIIPHSIKGQGSEFSVYLPIK